MDIPFEKFADLVHRLGKPPNTKRFNRDGVAIPHSPDQLFLSWLNHLPRPFPPKTGKRLFRLLFPEEGSRRRYALKETKLSEHLECILGVTGLRQWDSVGWEGRGGTACLGEAVKRAMENRIPAGTKSTLTLGELDALLDELATPSPYSQLSQLHSRPRDPSLILRQLFRDSFLSPYALSVLTQVILRDLRPLLSPVPTLPIRNPTAMLRVKTTAGPRQLSRHVAMWCWNPIMARLYAEGKGSFDWCADAAEAVSANPTNFVPIATGPKVGVVVQTPKCKKGRSISDALSGFFGRSGSLCPTVWAETKYDGYRMQIHVALDSDGSPTFTIFSKSKRQSTDDRINTHSIILAALGLTIPDHLPRHPALANRLSSTTPRRRMTSSVILEAEVIPFNEGEREGGRGPGIEEFWWLQSAGVTAGPGIHAPNTSRSRHLCLALFDILHLDGEGLLKVPYSHRRQLLEEVTVSIHGFSFLAARTEIPLYNGKRQAEETLRRAFERSSENREEGLVLKSSDSLYNDAKRQWIKLKKDYIENLGDCIDLVILGAGWDLDRARELRVDTSVFTTFYVGVLTNRAAVSSRREAPHFEILFRVSYGMSRDQLELYNENLRHQRWGNKPFDKNDAWKRRLIGLSWRYTMPRGMTPPSVLLEQPLCAEVMGAGFQKLPFSNLYELRWPRLMKIYERKERPWTEALDVQGLKEEAHRALGYAKSQEALTLSSPEDSIKALWRSKSAMIEADVVDLTNLPLTPSPKSRARTSPGRQASAPCVLNLSPETPRRRLPGASNNVTPPTPLRFTPKTPPRRPGPLLPLPSSPIPANRHSRTNTLMPTTPSPRLRKLSSAFVYEPPAKRRRVQSAVPITERVDALLRTPHRVAVGDAVKAVGRASGEVTELGGEASGVGLGTSGRGLGPSGLGLDASGLEVGPANRDAPGPGPGDTVGPAEQTHHSTRATPLITSTLPVLPTPPVSSSPLRAAPSSETRAKPLSLRSRLRLARRSTLS